MKWLVQIFCFLKETSNHVAYIVSLRNISLSLALGLSFLFRRFLVHCYVRLKILAPQVLTISCYPETIYRNSSELVIILFLHVGDLLTFLPFEMAEWRSNLAVKGPRRKIESFMLGPYLGFAEDHDDGSSFICLTRVYQLETLNISARYSNGRVIRKH